MSLCDDLRRYELEHGMDCPDDRAIPHGKCARCGELIEAGDRHFSGRLRIGEDDADVRLHKECFLEHILDRYTEVELATALGLEEVP